MHVGNPLTSSHALTPQDARRRSALREDQRQQIIGLLMLLVSIALFVAPWVVDSPVAAKDAHRNEQAVGMIVFFLTLARFRWRPGKWPDVVVLLSGVWLIVAPWLLGLQNTAFTDGARVVHVVAGSVLVLLSLASLLLLRSARHTGERRG